MYDVYTVSVTVTDARSLLCRVLFMGDGSLLTGMRMAFRSQPNKFIQL